MQGTSHTRRSMAVFCDIRRHALHSIGPYLGPVSFKYLFDCTTHFLHPISLDFTMTDSVPSQATGSPVPRPPSLRNEGNPFLANEVQGEAPPPPFVKTNEFVFSDDKGKLTGKGSSNSIDLHRRLSSIQPSRRGRVPHRPSTKPPFNRGYVPP